MRRIKFVKPLGIREGQGAGPHYEADKVYTFDGAIPEGYAQAYIDRGFAVEHKDEPKPKIEEPKVEVKPEVKAEVKPEPKPFFGDKKPGK